MSLKKELKIDFRIKLLSGNNVVLVEATGYESEIFIPEILNGRINFQNIIPNRRAGCDSTVALNVASTRGSSHRKKSTKNLQLNQQQQQCKQPQQQHQQQHQQQQSQHNQQQNIWPVKLITDKPTTEKLAAEKPAYSPSRTWRMLAGDEVFHNSLSPLAYSTPAPAPSPSASYDAKLLGNKENVAPHTRSIIQKNISHDSNNSVKIVRRVRTANPNTKSVRVQCDSPTLQIGDSGFNIPEVPNLSNKLPTHIPRVDIPKETPKRNSVTVTPASATKWRKCLTPARTYLRHGVSILPSNSNTKKSRSVKKVPSATQGIKGTHKVELRRRKLTIDPKLNISPFSFKMQQRNTSHLEGKSPTHLKAHKMNEVRKATSFELLTSANRARVMAAKLDHQFKKACINKASSTCTNYKLLCNIPPLDYNQRPEAQTQKVQKLRSHKCLPPHINLTAAAMMERACTAAMQKPDYVPICSRLRRLSNYPITASSKHG